MKERCKHLNSYVVDSRHTTYSNKWAIRRRRDCKDCDESFSTYELTNEFLSGITKVIATRVCRLIEESVDKL